MWVDFVSKVNVVFMFLISNEFQGYCMKNCNEHPQCTFAYASRLNDSFKCRIQTETSEPFRPPTGSHLVAYCKGKFYNYNLEETMNQKEL